MIRSQHFTEDLQTVLEAVLVNFFPEPDYLISRDWISSEKLRMTPKFQIMFYDMEKTDEIKSEGMEAGTDTDGNRVKGSWIEYTFQLELRCTAAAEIEISGDETNKKIGIEMTRVIDRMNEIFDPEQLPSLLESTEGQITVVIGTTTYTDKTIFELGLTGIEIGEFRSLPVSDTAKFYRKGTEIKVSAYRSQKVFTTYTDF